MLFIPIDISSIFFDIVSMACLFLALYKSAKCFIVIAFISDIELKSLTEVLQVSYHDLLS